MKKQKSIIIGILMFLLLGFFIGARFYFYNNDFDEIVDLIKMEPNEVIVPPPLRGPTDHTITSNLTVAGIIAETNKHRLQHGLDLLFSDLVLCNVADMKAEDMFGRQYFAHESPTGEGPSDLSDVAGYDYLIIGENLALGNYENDAVLVQAWMDSPGHRTNILNPQFTEIGVAVKKGIYEDNLVWMAIQEFGRPVSDCPLVDESLLVQINENEQLLEKWAEELDRKSKNRFPGYAREMDEYNELVDRYNELLQDTQRLVDEYNNQVIEHNLCIQ